VNWLHTTPFADPTLQRHESPTLLQSVLPGRLASPPPPSVLPPKHAEQDAVMHTPRSGSAAASAPHDCASTPPAQLASEVVQLDAPQQDATCPAHALAMHAPQTVPSPEKWHAADR
jgi:hypothetical protein